jgi:hypothetical protein
MPRASSASRKGYLNSGLKPCDTLYGPTNSHNQLRDIYVGTTNFADLYAYSNRIALSSFIRSSYVFSVRCPIQVGSESTHCESGPKHILAKYLCYIQLILQRFISFRGLQYIAVNTGSPRTNIRWRYPKNRPSLFTCDIKFRPNISPKKPTTKCCGRPSVVRILGSEHIISTVVDDVSDFICQCDLSKKNYHYCEQRGRNERRTSNHSFSSFMTASVPACPPTRLTYVFWKNSTQTCQNIPDFSVSTRLSCP